MVSLVLDTFSEMQRATDKFSGDTQVLLICLEKLLQGNSTILLRISAAQSESGLLCKIKPWNISEITVWTLWN